MTADGPLRLALAGGGTGGHVVPGLHLLEALEQGPAPLEDLLWLGAGRAVEDRVLSDLERRVGRAEVERVALALEPEGGGAPSLAGLAVRLAPAVRRARRALAAHRSQVLLGLGGFTTVPAVLAARSLGLPVALLEINAVAGRATRWLARWSARVYHAWPSTLPAGGEDGRHVHVGPPLSPRLLTPPTADEARAFRAAHGLPAEGPLLLVLGGSQGALGLNRFVAEHAGALLAGGLSVLHQVGPGRLEEAAQVGAQLGTGPPGEVYRAVEYLDEVPTALHLATLVLCRGGASTLAEVGAVARPAWVVPYPHHADRHQERNAERLGEGVRIVPEETLGAEWLAALLELVGPAGGVERERMRTCLRDAVPADAAERIGRGLVELARA